KLVLRCLRKEASRRYQTMADLKVALEDLEAETASGLRTQPSPAPAVGLPNRRMAIRKLALIAAVASAAVIVTLIALRVFRRPPQVAPQRTVKFTFTPTKLGRGSDTDVDAEVSISPDGKHITYVESEGGQLWVRDI